MSAFATALRRLVGLFVDDGSLALAIVAWLCLVGIAAALWPAAVGWLGLVLALGLLAILAENVLRAGRAMR